MKAEKVGVSYSWKAEEAGPHAGTVASFCESMEVAGVDVLRDIHQVNFGDSLTDFMKELGTSEHLCIFLSEKYLESPYCMYELLTAWRKAMRDRGEFRKRVHTLVLGELDIDDSETRHKCRTFWKEKWAREQALLKKYGDEDIGPDERENIKRIGEIASEVQQVLNTIRETLRPQKLEEFTGWMTRGGTSVSVRKPVVAQPQDLVSFSPPEEAQIERPPWAARGGEDEFGRWSAFDVNDVPFTLRWIPAGRFRMGSPDDEVGRLNYEGPQHEVEISRGFWLGETPVTQAQYEAVVGKNPSHFEGRERPVECVTWNEAVAFCQALGRRIPRLGAALPSEAQWEYACRAGTTTAFNSGRPCTQPEGRDSALQELGWFSENSGGETHPVKGKRPNAWGLYDMHGNVFEWCQDGRRRYTGASATDPKGPLEGARRAIRGGSWLALARACRSAYRYELDRGVRLDDLGLRLAAGL